MLEPDNFIVFLFLVQIITFYCWLNQWCIHKQKKLRDYLTSEIKHKHMHTNASECRSNVYISTKQCDGIWERDRDATTESTKTTYMCAMRVQVLVRRLYTDERKHIHARTRTHRWTRVRLSQKN